MTGSIVWERLLPQKSSLSLPNFPEAETNAPSLQTENLNTDLATVGVRLADDLTVKQRSVLRELRRQGLIAHHREARLFSRPGPQSDTHHQTAPDNLVDVLHFSAAEIRQPSTTSPDPEQSLSDTLGATASLA